MPTRSTSQFTSCVSSSGQPSSGQPSSGQPSSGQPSSGEPGEKRADQAAEDAQYYRRVLHDIIDRGSDLLRLIHEQAAAQAQAAKTGTSAAAVPAPCIAPDLALAFDRVARAVRRTIALAQKLAQPVPVKLPADPARAEQDRARRRIIREVEDAKRRAPDGNFAATLSDEVLDRLDPPEIDDDDDRSIAEIIADICLDLGLETPFGVQPARRPPPRDTKAVYQRPGTPRPKSPSATAPGAVPPRTRTGSDPPL